LEVLEPSPGNLVQKGWLNDVNFDDFDGFWGMIFMSHFLDG